MTPPLKLETNKHLEWCLARLKARTDFEKSNAKLLSLFQSPAAYYACLGVKRHKTCSNEERKNRAAEAYNGYVVDGWMAWLLEQCNFQLPSWINKEMFGKSTLGGDQNLYDPKQDVLWRRYTDAGREIRADFNTIMDDYLVGQGALPSGELEGDLQQHLQQELWRRRIAGKKKVKKKSGKASPEGVSNVKSADAASATGATVPAPRLRRRRRVRTHRHEQAVPTTQALRLEKGRTIKRVIRVLAVMRPMRDVDMPMPPIWIHPYSLVFCLFGRVANKRQRDPDLDLSMGTGPPNKKRRGDNDSEVACEDDSGSAQASASTRSNSSNLSKRAIKMMVGAGESQSRADMKNCTASQTTDVTTSEFRQQILHNMQNPHTDKEQVELVSCVRNIATIMAEKAAQGARDREIARKTAEITLLEQMGDVAEAMVYRVQLRALFKAPVIVLMSAPTRIASTAAAATPAGDNGLMRPPLGSGLSMAAARGVSGRPLHSSVAGHGAQSTTHSTAAAGGEQAAVAVFGTESTNLGGGGDTQGTTPLTTGGVFAPGGGLAGASADGGGGGTLAADGSGESDGAFDIEIM